MAIKTIEYTVDIAGIAPAAEQFAGTQGDHRVAEIAFTISDTLYSAITAAAQDSKALYRFDVYDGEGGIWSSDAAEISGNTVSIELEERHTRYGGKITVYLVITALSADNETEIELYSFPAVLRLNNRLNGIVQDGENYESVTGLVEMAKAKADEAAQSADNASNTVDEAVARLEETAKITFGKSAYQVAVENGFEGTEKEWLESLKGEKGDVGPQGEQGIQGEQGAQGIQGVQGEKGDKGDAFTYGDLTDEQKSELKEGIEQCIADQTYNAESENAQSGVAVAEAIQNCVPKKVLDTAGAPFYSALTVNNSLYTSGDIDGNGANMPVEYGYQAIDDGTVLSKDMVSSANRWLVARDSSGNLWTGTPVDDEDCVNKKFVEDGFVPQQQSNGMTYEVYALSPGGNCKLEVEDNDFFEYSGSYGRIPYRQTNGNLLTNTPVKDLDCVNKAYVDALKAEIDELRAMIEELKG